MIRNYLKTALRSLGKRPGFTTINTVGLSVALACCLLVGLFVQSEWTYDAFHENADRLYRAWNEEHYEDKDLKSVITPLPLGPTVERTFPEVQETVRLYTPTDLVRRGDTQFRERMHLVNQALVQQRTKKIGVRKALGATAAQIVGLLSKEFAVIVGLSFVVAAPVAYFGAQRWLQDLAYHIELGPTLFVLAGGLTLAIALGTVSLQTLRAARIDPATTLRDE